MKLVRIDHIRCQDFGEYTFIGCPEDWDSDVIDEKVRAAQKEYEAQVLVAAERKKNNGPPNPGYQPKWENYPDLTVAQIKEEHAKKKFVYDEWQKQDRKTTHKFEHFLTQQGFISFWADDADFYVAEVDWGHQHGKRLEYGNHREIDGSLSPAKLVGGGDYDEDDFA